MMLLYSRVVTKAHCMHHADRNCACQRGRSAAFAGSTGGPARVQLHTERKMAAKKGRKAAKKGGAKKAAKKGGRKAAKKGGAKKKAAKKRR